MSPVIRVLLKVTRFLQQSGHFDPCTTVVRVATEFTVPFSSMLWLRLVAASPHPTYVALGGSNTAGTQRGSNPGLPGPQTALLLTRVSLAFRGQSLL